MRDLSFSPGPLEEKIHHVAHYFDSETLSRLFTEAGFKVQKTSYILLNTGKIIAAPSELEMIRFRYNVGIVAIKQAE